MDFMRLGNGGFEFTECPLWIILKYQKLLANRAHLESSILAG
jgi:hypothetical protein